MLSPQYWADFYYQMLCIYFLTCMHAFSCVCVCVYLHSCLCARSQWALWQPAAPLPATLCHPAEPPPSSSSPLPSKSARGARGTRVPQRTVFWVLNQGDGPRQQLPFSFYTIGVIPASCVLLPWSDVDLEVLHPLSHLHTLAHFSLARPFSWAHTAKCRSYNCKLSVLPLMV